jgi:hypothetical protein
MPTEELPQILTATFTPSITATFTLAPVTMTAGQALSCVKGPDWKLYEWVAGIAEGETVTLIARAVPEIPDYYVVRKSNGTECWAFGGGSTINGSTAGLPVRETPPLPQVTYVIKNSVLINLCDVYIRPMDEAAWGIDRLGAEIIPTNSTFSVTLTAGYYDVQIKDCFFTVLYEEHDRAIGSDPAFRYQEIANDVDFHIQNNFPHSLCLIEIRWEFGSYENLYNAATDGGPIPSGGRKDFTRRTGTYQFRGSRCDGTVAVLVLVYLYPGMGGITWA